MKGKERKFWQEFLINFALIYSFILGTTMVFYAMIKDLFHYGWYVGALIGFLVYLTFWVIDKMVVFGGQSAENTNSI